MKKNTTPLLIVFIFTLVIYSNNSIGQWSQLNVGPASFFISGITSNTNYLFSSTIATGGGIYRSSNNGANWTACNNGLYGPYTTCLASRNDTVFAGQSGSSSKFYLSADSGASWQMKGLDGWNHNHILFDGYDIYVSTSYGVYKTTNSGQNWTLLIQIPNVNSFAKSSLSMFTGTTSLGMRYSTNNGSNWLSTNNYSNSNIKSLIYYSGNLYGAIYGTGFASFNQTSGNWELKNSGLINLNINLIYRVGNTIFACTQGGGIFTAIIGTWNGTSHNEGMSNLNIYSLGIKGLNIFAGSDSGKIYKRLTSELISVNNVSTTVPDKFELEQNYPNPFNPTTKIKFDIPNLPLGRGVGGMTVTLKVFDILGKEIATLVNNQLQPGTYEVTFDGTNFPSGIYFYQLKAGEFVETKKLVLLK